MGSVGSSQAKEEEEREWSRSPTPGQDTPTHIPSGHAPPHQVRTRPLPISSGQTQPHQAWTRPLLFLVVQLLFTGSRHAHTTILFQILRPEAKFLDVIGTKGLRVFLLAIQSHL